MTCSIAYDPLDPEEAAILDLNGNLLTFAKAEKYLPQSSDSQRRDRREHGRAPPHGEANCRDHHGIREARASNGAISEVEHLVKRARVLPMAVGEFMTQRKPRIRPDDRPSTAPPADCWVIMHRGLIARDE